MFFEWIETLLIQTTAVGALLTLAGWMFRQQISAWLNKDLERLKATHLQQLEAKKSEYQQDLEAKKSEYQRDLEGYRVSLIAAAERSKAEAEIKKSAALFIVEKKFRSLDRLHAATLGIASEFVAAAQLAPDDKENFFEELSAKNDELRSAGQAAEIFLTYQQKKILLEYRTLLIDFQHDHCSAGAKSLGEDESNLYGDPLLHLELKVDAMLHEQVRLMSEMT